MRRPRLALLAGSLLALLAAPTAHAITPPGTVTVETDGCSFVVHIDLDQQADIVGWTVNASTKDDWDDGTTIASGKGSTDADGKLSVGPMTADAGEYNVVVDDESPVDSSSIVEHFVLTCETGGEAPTNPTPTPTGEELPVKGTPPPGGNVLGLTPPPTNTVPTAERETGAPSVALLLAILAIAVSSLMFALRPSNATRRRAGRDVR